MDEITKSEEHISPMETKSTVRLIDRIRTEPIYRYRLMNTGFVVWMFITLGWNAAVVGSVFPDLRLIIHKDLDTASWMFTDGSIGYLMGALIFGILFDRYDRLWLLTMVTVLCAVTFAIVPWCENFAVLLVVNFFNGIFSGGIDVGGNTHVASIWGRNSAPYMQAIHFGFSFGGIISPFTAEPFVAEKHCKNEMGNVNTSYSDVDNKSVSVDMTTILAQTSTDCEEIYGVTHIQYAYLIGAVVALSAAFPFLFTSLFSKQRQSEIEAKNTGDDDVIDKSRGRLPELSIKQKCLFVGLLMLLISLYAAVEGRFSALLSSFVVDYQDWSKADSLHISSLFWGAFAAGRFISIGVARLLKPSSMILTYILSLIVSFVGFLAAAEYELRVLIWVCTATIGLSMSSIFPCIFTWTAESILKVTGKISAVYLVGVSVFNSVLPLVYGYLMDNVDPMYFTYLLLSQSVLCFVIYVSIRILVNVYIIPFDMANAI